jgi:hypothetical protein
MDDTNEGNRVRFFSNEDESGYHPLTTMEGWEKGVPTTQASKTDIRAPIIKNKPLYIHINETQTPKTIKKHIQIGNSGRETELKR